MIHTAEENSQGSLGDVYLALHGLNAASQELKLPERTFDSEAVESGVLEVSGDLGELQTGSMRTEGAERDSWAPDWIKVINLSDGREWTAPGGVCSSDGSCPLLRFEKTSDPLEVQKSKQGPSDAAPKSNRSVSAVVRTYEIFGKNQGRVVPLAQILKLRAGRKQLSPGAQILITDQDSQGFGLGGEPGMWDDLYPGVSPAVYGLEPDMAVMGSDGSRGWVMDAHYLAMIFGADWRRVVYGK